MSGEGNYEVTVLFDGYSKATEGGMLANCSCTLIKGPKKIIVDTMTAWDGQKLTDALTRHNIQCEDVDYVICTHGHSDHIGCNYLFLKATHIVGHSISSGDRYFDHNFEEQPEYVLDSQVKVVATPGHTLQDVSVIVETKDKGIVVIAGDLFEKREDLNDSTIWKDAGSDSQTLQINNRRKILDLADWIVPGHGPMFKVQDKIVK